MHRATLADAMVIMHPLSVSTCVSDTPLWSACVSTTPCQSAPGVSNTPSMETRADETAMHRATLADAKVTTLETTQGQISSQFPTDATSGR
jgi:hypothetical protein